MSRELAVLLGGRLVGVLRRGESARLTFRYEEAWQEAEDAYPLSLSIPYSRRDHPHQFVEPYLKNLLPDNDHVLERWGRRFHVSPKDVFGLLEHVGEDCAGAVQFCRPERVDEMAAGEGGGEVEWLSEPEVAQRLREVRSDPAAVRRPEDSGYFSLPGAQPKVALFHEEGRWGVPAGRLPTNVILKPPQGGLQGFALNEHLCLSLASTLGLRAASSRVLRFEDQVAIAVDRYDRVKIGGRWTRIHQEDFCQALGVAPESKYEERGGPGAADVLSVIRSRSTRAGLDGRRFVEALALNWAIAGTDAHAKNYSMLLAPGQARLAPLYDLVSILPYPKEVAPRKAKLAMRLGREYHVWKIGGRHWRRLAEETGLDLDEVLGWVRGILERVPDQLVAVCAAVREQVVGEDLALVDDLEQEGTAHALQCLRNLDRVRQGQDEG